MKLPQVNQRVSVVVENGERRLATRVEGVSDDGTVVIAPPSSNGVAYPLVIGEEIALEWPSARGLVRGRGAVARRSWENDVPLIDVTIWESAILQRREFVRAQAVVRGELVRDGENPVPCASLDLSGSGVSLVVADCALEVGETVLLAMWLPDMGEIQALATVVRCTDTGEYGLRFMDIEPSVRERLIRFVFAEHRVEFATLRRKTA
jgi:c-di-GMP-binding flagellar brake protein YcgR